MKFSFTSKSFRRKRKTETRKLNKSFPRIQVWRSHTQQDASEYWDDNLNGKLSKEEKILWAKQLFCHVWQTKGKDEALSFLPNRELAVCQFDRGCQLWAERQYPQALWELQTSISTQETVASEDSFEDVLAKMKSHYALGMVHLSLENYALSLCQFLQSWRISAFQYHDNVDTPKEVSVLLQASKFMMRKALTMSYGVMEVHVHMARLQKSMDYELEGEFSLALGDLEMAMENFQMAIQEVSQTNHPQEENHHFMFVQANLRCKLAKLYESLDHLDLTGDADDLLELAGEEWATSLCLYQTLLGLEHSTTKSTQKSFIENHSAILNRRRLYEEQVYEI